jgi:hypothetical protein
MGSKLGVGGRRRKETSVVEVVGISRAGELEAEGPRYAPLE